MIFRFYAFFYSGNPVFYWLTPFYKKGEVPCKVIMSLLWHGSNFIEPWCSSKCSIPTLTPNKTFFLNNCIFKKFKMCFWPTWCGTSGNVTGKVCVCLYAIDVWEDEYVRLVKEPGSVMIRGKSVNFMNCVKSLLHRKERLFLQKRVFLLSSTAKHKNLLFNVNR